MRTHISWALFAMAALAGCSGIARRESDQQTLDRYLSYAGAPIERFTNLGRYNGWQVLNPEQLVVWTGINDAYLLTVSPPCSGLQFANRIGLTSTNSTVSLFESVRFGNQRCPIKEIRPIDYRKMQQDARAQHS